MKRSDPLVAILQLTPGMLAGDLSPTRLEQARRKLLDLLRTRNDAQTAIVVYAGSAHTLVPLSDDQLTARNLLDALKPSIMPEPGQRADLAVRQALDLLEQGAQGRGRLLLLTSGLSEPERQGIRSALEHRRRASPCSASARRRALRCSRRMAASSGRSGRHPPAQARRKRAAPLRRGDRRRLPAPAERPRPRQPRPAGPRRHAGGRPRERPAALAALGRPGVLAAPAAAPAGRLCRTARLAVLPAAVDAEPAATGHGLPVRRPLAASGPARPAPVATGPGGRGGEALRGLPLERPVALPGPRLRRRGQAFAQGDQADDHYNRGNALARQGELEVDAYEQALERQPQLVAAQRNKALVEELLRQRQEQAAQRRPARTRNSARKRASRARHPEAASGRRAMRRPSMRRRPGRGALDQPAGRRRREDRRSTRPSAASPTPRTSGRVTRSRRRTRRRTSPGPRAMAATDSRRSRRVAAAQVLVPTAATPGSHAMIRLFCSLLLALLCVSAHASFSASVDRARLTEGKASNDAGIGRPDPLRQARPEPAGRPLRGPRHAPGQPSRHAERSGPGHHPLDRHPPAEAERLRGDPADQPRRQQHPADQGCTEERATAPRAASWRRFIDASVDQEKVYVQAQAISTLRIYHSVSLYDDSSLTPLTMNDAKVEQLGEALPPTRGDQRHPPRRDRGALRDLPAEERHPGDSCASLQRAPLTMNDAKVEQLGEARTYERSTASATA